MKTSLIFVLILIFGMIIVGVGTLERRVLILLIPLITYLFAAIYGYPEGINLAVTREVLPDYLPQGIPFTIKLTITNQGPTIDELFVQDILPHGTRKIVGNESTVCFLQTNGTIELEYMVEANRGQYDIYEVWVGARDYFDLFERSTVYRTAPCFAVQPRYTKLAPIKVRPPQLRGFAGPIAARQGGSGIDFWGIREYQMGDPQRQINWKIAARSYQELYVNTFEQERVADIGIILDARQSPNVGTLFEYSVQATAALAENFLDDGNRVGLLIYGCGMVRVSPGYGRMHLDRILRALSSANLGTDYIMDSLAHLPTRIFPAKSQLVIVSPLMPEDVAVIGRMRAYGYAVMVISPDPVSYEAAANHDSTSPAYRIACVERQFIMRQLHGKGVQIVNWPVDQPLEEIVRETLIPHRVSTRVQ